MIETGDFDYNFCQQVFSKYKLFHQKGENTYGGVILLVRNDLKMNRVECSIPNICGVNIETDRNEALRVVGVYAPESKSWNWHDLTTLISHKCTFFGGFNVDLEKDKDKAEILTLWADSHLLSPYTSTQSTSLRSDKLIDYVLSTGIPVSIHSPTKEVPQVIINPFSAFYQLTLKKQHTPATSDGRYSQCFANMSTPFGRNTGT